MKFNDYLFGKKFTLITDHKPLVKILGPKTGVPALAAARLQRWALILGAYQYDIQYKLIQYCTVMQMHYQGYLFRQSLLSVIHISECLFWIRCLSPHKIYLRDLKRTLC